MTSLLDQFAGLAADDVAAIVATLPPETRTAVLAEVRREETAHIAGDPARWAVAKGVHLWSKQVEIMDSLRDHRITAVHSCHAVGKSFNAALAICWWIESGRPGKRVAFSTAPRGFQVKSILWAELNKMHSAMHLPGRMNQTEWWMRLPGGVETMVAWGRKPPDNDEASFQGVHAEDGVLIIVDEASGISAKMISDLEKNMTGPKDRIMLIGNPDDATSRHAEMCSGDVAGVHVIHIDAYESPNFTGETVPASLAASLVSKAWVADQRAAYGEDSALFQARVRGLFPLESADGVVTASMRAKAMLPLDDDEPEPRILGVDVGAGGDWTVAQLRVGMTADRQWRIKTASAEITASDLVAVIVDTQAVRVRVDAIGVGWGIVGALQSAASRGEHHAIIEALNVSEVAEDSERFVNRRSEMWWNARILSQSGQWSIGGAPENAIKQLCWPKWSLDPRGKIRVEPKKETIKRHGHSPDDADALLMAFYDATVRAYGGLDSWGTVEDHTLMDAWVDDRDDGFG